MWLKYYRVHNTSLNTAIKTRPPTRKEAARFLQIPKGGRQTRHDGPVVFICKWPEVEQKLLDAFIARRDLGNLLEMAGFDAIQVSFGRKSTHVQSISLLKRMVSGVFVSS